MPTWVGFAVALKASDSVIHREIEMATRQIIMVIGVGVWLMILTVTLAAGCSSQDSAENQERAKQTGKETAPAENVSTMPASAPSVPQSIRVPLGEVLEVPDGTPDGEWLKIGGDTPLLWCYRGGKRLIFEQEGPKVYLSVDGKPSRPAGIIVRSKEEAMLLDDVAKTSEALTVWIYSPHIKHLPALKFVDSIDSIHVWEGERGLLTDLSPLSSASKLTSLSIQRCEKVSDLSPLKKLKRLSSLDLRYNNDIDDIKPLTALPIVWLDARRTYLPHTAIESLGQLQQLRHLKIDAPEKKTPIPLEKVLSKLPQLERLSLRRGWGGDAKEGDRLISFGKPPSLRSLVIEDISIRTVDLSSLAGLADLRDLRLLGRLNADVDLSPITDLRKLRTLRLEIRGIMSRKPSDPPADLTPILRLKSLENLEIASHPPTRGHDRIGELPNLRRMALSTPSLKKTPKFQNPGKLVSVDFVEHYHRDGNSSLRDITSLGELVNLEELHIDGCPGVGDYSALSKLAKLRRLNISYPGVKTLAPLAGLVNLEELLVHDSEITDLSPLKSLKKLRVLEFDIVVGRGTPRNPKLPPMMDLAGIDGLPELKWLRLDRCRAQGLDRVVFPALERVAMPYNLTTGRFARFVEHHPKLTHLSIAGRTPFLYHVDIDFGPLSKLNRLSSLFASGMRSLEPVRGLHRLTRLHVVRHKTDWNLDAIKNLRQLRYLILHPVSANRTRGWDALRSLPNVFKISPSGAKSTDRKAHTAARILYERGSGYDSSRDIPDQRWR